LRIEQKVLTEAAVGAQLEAREHRAQRLELTRAGAQMRTSTKASLRRSRR
jgi:hypothetical protein